MHPEAESERTQSILSSMQTSVLTEIDQNNSNNNNVLKVLLFTIAFSEEMKPDLAQLISNINEVLRNVLETKN